ncbi:MAG: alpha-D-glucose phosphate-specific phosphoglucomutase [Alphaproteobacteria bacterium]|nr:alpha-D-glucose phosphate-specific phosphoglucomutase [Alphaproteobacteria bacterium]
MDIISVKTEPYQGQVPGTSGLRKKVSVFKQNHYLENFIQSVFDSLDSFEGKTLVIGGDGRYYNDYAVQVLLKMAIANQFGRIIVGQNGILSTPATSYVIVKYGAMGGFILSASHNPGGPDGDFGIKFDNENGAPAPQELTDKFAKRTREIDHFWWADMPDIDLTQVGELVFGSTVVQVIDPVSDYAAYMQKIFDFKQIKRLFDKGFRMTFDAMNAVTGPYAKYIFEDLLGAPRGSVIRQEPLMDFGGLHPEPNLTYATELVSRMYSEQAPDFGTASDGDGDRYMILGRSFFVNPSDSLAVLAGYLDTIPFYRGKMTGVARSMPTSFAVDDVAKDKNLTVYQTPTGWKFFGSLLTAGKITLCGEESFGAGSYHLQEKDGIWAVLCWLSILAKTGKSVEQLVRELWQKQGRVFTLLHNYDIADKGVAEAVMAGLKEKLPLLPGTVIQKEKITQAFPFVYTDPVTGEVADNQGLCIYFESDARIVFRLSGTNSVGATLKIYINQRVREFDKFDSPATEVLDKWVHIALELSELKRLTGVEKPSMIT